MLGNEMYTNSKASCLFEQQMAAGAAWFLFEANVEYLSIKAHVCLSIFSTFQKHTNLGSTFSSARN